MDIRITESKFSIGIYTCAEQPGLEPTMIETESLKKKNSQKS